MASFKIVWHDTGRRGISSFPTYDIWDAYMVSDSWVLLVEFQASVYAPELWVSLYTTTNWLVYVMHVVNTCGSKCGRFFWNQKLTINYPKFLFLSHSFTWMLKCIYPKAFSTYSCPSSWIVPICKDSCDFSQNLRLGWLLIPWKCCAQLVTSQLISNQSE